MSRLRLLFLMGFFFHQATLWAQNVSVQPAITITVTAGAGGTITPSGAVNMDYGTSQKFTVTADSGYQVNQVLVNGSPVALDSTGSYTFTYVVPIQTITASFSQPTSTPPAVSLTPSDNIEAAVAANPSGTTFMLGPGVYRMQRITPAANDIFIGSGEGVTILNGAQVLSFEPDPAGSGYWVAGATANNATSGTCQTAYPLCGYAQDLFINDALQAPASTLTGLQPGTWYFDRTNNLVYVPANPAGQTVELSMTPVAFSGTAAGVQISQMTIEKYAVLAQYGAIGSNIQPGPWTVDNVEMAWNHGSGLKLGNGSLIENSFMHNNGQFGFMTGGANVTLINNEDSYNNYAGFATNWGAGAGKSWATTNLRAVSNNVHDNLGNGLWTDDNNVGTLYDSNTIMNNLDSGIIHEISYNAIIRNNTVEGNGNSTPAGMWNAQINVANSSNVEVYGNTLIVPSGNANGIGLINESRGTGTLGPWYAANDYIHNNTITYLGAGGLTGVNDTLGGNTAVNNLFDNDQYTLQGGGSTHWMLTATALTWAQFQAAGQEPHGSDSVDPVTYGEVLAGDTKVTLQDAVAVAEYVIGLPVAINVAAAEVDGTASVTLNDATLIAQYAIGAITRFPIQS